MRDTYLVGAALVEGGTVQRKGFVNRAEIGQKQEQTADMGRSKW